MSFQLNYARPTFGVLKEPGYASDYLTTKKNFCINKKKCVNKKKFNSSNLISNLYSKENLLNVCVLSKITNNACNIPIEPLTTINPPTLPFYQMYIIDPTGELFGKTTCGINNYTNYVVPNIQK